MKLKLAAVSVKKKIKKIRNCSHIFDFSAKSVARPNSQKSFASRIREIDGYYQRLSQNRDVMKREGSTSIFGHHSLPPLPPGLRSRAFEDLPAPAISRSETAAPAPPCKGPSSSHPVIACRRSTIPPTSLPVSLDVRCTNRLYPQQQ